MSQMLDVSFDLKTPHLHPEMLAPKHLLATSFNLKMLILHESVIAESLV